MPGKVQIKALRPGSGDIEAGVEFSELLSQNPHLQLATLVLYLDPQKCVKSSLARYLEASGQYFPYFKGPGCDRLLLKLRSPPDLDQDAHTRAAPYSALFSKYMNTTYRKPKVY